MTRRLFLMLVPNGEWRNRQVEMYVPSTSTMTAEEAERIVCNGLVTVLAGHMFELYPRSRWCGADLAVDRCGLLESAHGLGFGTYKRFISLMGGQVPEEEGVGPEVDQAPLPPREDGDGGEVVGEEREPGDGHRP